MSRYIDADALIKDLQERYCRPCKAAGLDYNETRCRACQFDDEIDDIDGFADNIEEAPSIDIVCCGECKWWKESQYYPEVMACTYVKGATFTRQHDDFCSRGEREGE